MQFISTIPLCNYKVPVITTTKNFTFCPGKSRENFPNFFQDFPGLINKIQGLSRTEKKSRTFPGCGNPVLNSMWKCRKFSHLFCPVQCDLKKKKKVITPTEASFSPILCWSQKKKKVLRLSSASFLRDLCNIPMRGAVNRSCQRFLEGNKNAGFWQ